MILSDFGKKYTEKSGILELMDDLGKAMSGSEKRYMLGGGNPAHIPAVNKVWRQRMEEILANGDEFERMLANYDTPQGKGDFLDAVASLFSREFGWNIGPENVGVTNSSQQAFMCLLNMFSGPTAGGSHKKILFPLLPEYIGYADQSLDRTSYRAVRPRIETYSDNTFKYFIDFDNLSVQEDTGAVCVSRPTNPSGNVLTDEEVKHLAQLAGDRGVPLIIDNAYGTPFPNIMFSEANPYWDENTVVSMSLSKIGLPSTRTGIIIADKKIISALSAINAIMSLANGTVGQVITEPLIRDGRILELSNNVVRPFYKEKSDQAQSWIHDAFRGQPYRVHKSEGAIFLWLWFPEMKISSKELYNNLKKRDVIVVPGEYFFFGNNEEAWEHRRQCIRINYSQPAEDVETGIRIIAEEVKRGSI